MRDPGMDMFMMMKITELTHAINRLMAQSQPKENPTELSEDKRLSVLVAELRNLKEAVGALPHIAHAGGG